MPSNLSMTDRLQSSISEDFPDESGSAELVHRAQGGDGAALNELLERYQDRLQRIVRVRLGAHLRVQYESMDIVQEAFQVAWKKLPEFEMRGPGSLLCWLSRIAEHKIRDARDFLYAQKRDRNREQPLAPAGASQSGGSIGIPAQASRPDDRAARTELKEIIDGALAELSEEHREVIVLRDYCGTEWDEVALQLERGVPAAQELHRRAWIKLRRIVRPRIESGA